MTDSQQQKLKDSFKEQQSIDQNIKQSLSTSYLESPFFQFYKQKFYDRVEIPNLKLFQDKLQHKNITFMVSTLRSIPFRIQKIYASKNNKIINFKVKFSYFTLTINVLNLTQKDQLNIKFQKGIGSGTFGSVSLCEFQGKKFAVKSIPFKKIQSSIIVMQQAIKEFSIMKVLSVYEVGPVQLNLFGFDLVTTEEAVYFSSEQCLFLKQVFKKAPIQEIENCKSQLERSLKIMHLLSITHNDIKPQNIMYSHCLKKLVFIDFGLSQENFQPLGLMKQQRAKGSFHYCSQEMKKLLFSHQNVGYVDVFYNDYVAFQNTFYEINKTFKSKMLFGFQFFNQSNNDQQMINRDKMISGFQFSLMSQSESISMRQNDYFQDEQKMRMKTDLICINTLILISELNGKQIQQQFHKNPQKLMIISRLLYQ